MHPLSSVLDLNISWGNENYLANGSKSRLCYLTLKLFLAAVGICSWKERMNCLFDCDLSQSRISVNTSCGKEAMHDTSPDLVPVLLWSLMDFWKALHLCYIVHLRKKELSNAADLTGTANCEHQHTSGICQNCLCRQRSCSVPVFF